MYFPVEIWNIIKAYQITFNPPIETFRCIYRKNMLTTADTDDESNHSDNDTDEELAYDSDDDFIGYLVYKTYYHITDSWVFEIREIESEPQEPPTYQFYYLNRDRGRRIRNVIHKKTLCHISDIPTRLNDLIEIIPNHYINPINQHIIRKLLSKYRKPIHITLDNSNWFNDCDNNEQDINMFDYCHDEDLHLNPYKDYDSDYIDDFIENYKAYDVRNDCYEYTDFQRNKQNIN